MGLAIALTQHAHSAGGVALAPAQDTALHYQQCIAAISRKADDALTQALAWKDHGGGTAAEHCAALALIALKRPAEAAVYLDNIARETKSGPAKDRAVLLDQAGNAWLLAGVAQNAESLFSAALVLTPVDIDVLIDRATARAMAKDWAGAESDLSRAYALNKSSPEVLVLRSSARAAQGHKDQAKADIDAALALDATFPDALVERGAMKLQAGDKAGARADWLAVLARAPSSAAGAAARKFIANLDAAPPANPAPPVQPPANSQPRGQ